MIFSISLVSFLLRRENTYHRCTWEGPSSTQVGVLTPWTYSGVEESNLSGIERVSGDLFTEMGYGGESYVSEKSVNDMVRLYSIR